MDFKLHIIKREDIFDYSSRNRFCFAVVDLRKSKTYPSNFVCMLPMEVRKNKNENGFGRFFGENSVEQAKLLLTDALKTVDDSEVRVEIERRLKLLEPKQVNQIKCSGCGKLFQPTRKGKFKNYFCEECMKKRLARRD